VQKPGQLNIGMPWRMAAFNAMFVRANANCKKVNEACVSCAGG